MKKYLKKFVLYLLFFLIIILLISCPVEKEEEDSSTYLNLSVKDIFPSDDVTNVPLDSNIILYFNRNTDEATKGTVEIGGAGYSDGVNCDIIFPGGSPDTVIIDKYINFNAGDAYTGIKVYGFKDANGNTMPVYTDMNYNFTTVP